MNTKKLVLYIACSVDGYIAQPGDDLNFLDKVQREGEDYGYTDFTATVDTVIMGRRTYDWIMARCPEYIHHDKILISLQEQKGHSRGILNFIQEI